MRQYHDLLQDILDNGVDRGDRTGTGTRGVFGRQMRFDLSEGFPLVTTKKLHVRSIIVELLWFLRGETNVKWLQERGVSIWNEWASAEQCAKFGRPEGDLGPVYGHQWRRFGATKKPDGTYENDGVDQIRRVVDEIKRNPSSRRLIVTGWNPQEADQVALPPCHTLFQFYVSTDGRLSCQLYQRSADLFLGGASADFGIIGRADAFFRHEPSQCAGKIGLLQFLFFGAADARAHSLILIKPRPAGSGGDGTPSDHLIEQQGIEHLRRRAAQFFGQFLGGIGKV